MDKLTVLHVVEHLGIGGGEKSVCKLAEGLDRTGYNPLVVTFKGGELTGRLNQAGVTTLKAINRPKVFRVFSLMDLIKKHRVDVVHTHMTSAGYYGRVAAILTGRPVLHTFRTLNFMEKPTKRGLMEKVLGPMTDQLIGVSSAVCDHIETVMKWPGGSIKEVPNSIKLKPAGKPRKRFNDPVRLISVGRLEPVKGYDVLLKAVAALKHAGHRVALSLVGDGGMMGELKRLSQELALTNEVEFRGYRSDVPSELAAADVFVVTSHREGMSNALLEAMAAELPVIATRVGGNVEVVGEAGWLITPDDSDAVVKAVEQVLADPDQALEMGRRGRQRVADMFSIERTVGEYEKIYSKLFKYYQKNAE